MKHIPLGLSAAPLHGTETRLSYKSQLEQILRSPANPQAGADYDEIRRSIRILDALEKEDHVLVLEDADYEYLRERVLGTKWPLIDLVVLQFVEDVTSIKE